MFVIQSESECETLKDMVMERNQLITGMKTEIYRKEYRNDTEKVDLKTQVLHKDKKIKILEVSGFKYMHCLMVVPN